MEAIDFLLKKARETFSVVSFSAMRTDKKSPLIISGML